MKETLSWKKMETRIRNAVLTVLLGGMSATLAAAADIYVATNGAAPNDGSSWAAAYTNIQVALDAATNGADTIYLAGQTFVVTDQLVWTNDGVTVRGGYEAAGGSSPGTNNPTLWPTTIARTGGTAHRILKIDGADNSTLEQVTLTGGYTAANDEHGAGLLVTGNSQDVLLSGCTISNNLAQIGSVVGGGIRADSGTELTLTNCLISGNTVLRNVYSGEGSGGGIGAYGTLTLLDCRIQNNTAIRYGNDGMGGGLYFNGAQVTMRDVLLLNNASDGWGGGVYVSSGTVGMKNVLLAGNVADVNGGGLYVNSGTVNLLNCTLADSVNEGIRQAAGTVNVTNCVVWHNSVADIVGTVNASHSNVGDQDYGGDNISADPLFVNGYYLDAGSPSTNAGSDTATSLGLAGYAKNADGDVYDAAETVNHGWHAKTGVLDLYVSADGSDANDGSGPGSGEAFRTVNKALATARDGTRVNVSTGTYSQAVGEVFPLTVGDRFGISILGTNRQHTVMDATGLNERVVTLSAAHRAVLQGITLTGGQPVADNPQYGGGIYITGNSRGVLLARCGITNNTAGGNHNSGYGAGIAIAHDAEVVISNCLVSGNVNDGRGVGNGYGGGFHNAGTLAVRDSVICDNSVPSDGSGGGVYNSGIVELRNVLLAGNVAEAQGDGLYNSAGAAAAMNCTVANNAGEGVRQAAGTVSITNSILWGNGVDSTGGVTLAWSCYSNSTDHVAVGDNISTNPLFVDTTYYHLQSKGGNYVDGYFSGGTWANSSETSPCVDTGEPYPGSDYAREPDPNGKRVNMGCYGNTPVASLNADPRGTVITVR